MRTTRSRSGRFTRSSRRTIRRNPPVKRRPSPPKMTPAMRKKISLAVKAANRRRAAGRTTPVARAVSRPDARRSAVIRTSYRPVARRRSSRRSSRSMIPGLNKLGLGSVLSTQNLYTAGGAIIASVGTGYLLNKFGAQLPYSQTTYGKVAYSLGIPVVAAHFVRRKNRALADGLVIGGIIMAATTVIKSVAPATATVVQSPLGEFYTVQGLGLAGEVRAMGEYVGGRNPGTLGKDIGSSDAFSTSAW